MSFSGDVKEELVRVDSSTRHCQIAELSAILLFSGSIRRNGNGNTTIELHTDSEYLIKRASRLLDELFHIECNYDNSEEICIGDKKLVGDILVTLKLDSSNQQVDSVILKHACCKRAFIRGAFLCFGSMTNPEKAYHMEFACTNMAQVEQLRSVLSFFDVGVKDVIRKKHIIAYIKESEEIVEVLNIMGAHISLMNLENLRILKDMRNSINRKVNCEAANINKTVSAATKQIEDIQYIRDNYGFERLSDNLREIAEIRLDYTDASLKELGEYLNPPVGKSGVNHRLRKLGDLAERLKIERGEI